MDNSKLIELQQVCRYYEIDPEFLEKLNEFGLVEIVANNNSRCIEEDCLSQIETLMHLHYDLEINFEGLDAIHHMLIRMREMQKELIELRNKLSR
jgi:hypothetical protein